MKLEFNDEDLRETINSLPMSVLLIRVEPGNRFVLRAINNAAKALFQTDAAPEGRPVQEWNFSQEIRDRMQRNMTRCATSREVVVVENQIPLRDGTSVWSSNTMVPITDATGTVTGLFATAVDITELVNLRRAPERELASLASGFVTMCAWCNSIQEEDRWVSVDEYLIAHPMGETDTVVCPTCAARKATTGIAD